MDLSVPTPLTLLYRGTQEDYSHNPRGDPWGRRTFTSCPPYLSILSSLFPCHFSLLLVYLFTHLGALLNPILNSIPVDWGDYLLIYGLFFSRSSFLPTILTSFLHYSLCTLACRFLPANAHRKTTHVGSVRYRYSRLLFHVLSYSLSHSLSLCYFLPFFTFFLLSFSPLYNSLFMYVRLNSVSVRSCPYFPTHLVRLAN